MNGKYQRFNNLTDAEFQALKESIRTQGVLVPVELDERGDILDGHHRVRAWNELKAEGVPLADYPRIIRPNMNEDAKEGHVRTLNTLRRHLSKDEYAAKYAELRSQGMSLRQIAEATNTPLKTVHRTLQGVSYDTPETINGKDGKTYPATRPDPPQPAPTIGTPALNARSEREAQAAYRALPNLDIQPGQTLHAGDVKRQASAAAREERRDRAQSLPPGTYNVVYADPPWEYDNTIRQGGPALMHYSSMTLERIACLLEDIPLQVDDNAVLFLWVTNPFLRDAFTVLDAWGFAYKTNIAWVKTGLQKPGSGYYVRGRHELLFIATRGSMTPLVDVSPPIGSVLEAPLQEHSRKPDAVYSLIERLYPGCRYVELFARHRREGWDAHGDELD